MLCPIVLLLELRHSPGYKQKVKDVIQRRIIFPEIGVENGVGQAGGTGGLLIVRDLDLFSYCESCLLPFQESIKPTGAAVVLHCSHIHFPNFPPGVLDSDHSKWVKVIVGSGSGSFEKHDSAMWVDFLGLLRYKDINLETIRSRNQDSWCPSKSIKVTSSKSHMVTSVGSILRSLGQNPCNEELMGTPNRFVKWLMNFKYSKLEIELDEFSRIPSRTTIGCLNLNYKQHIKSELNLSLWSIEEEG
ncbi:hypothetical protein LXL04_014346 [Taraxacum kok-saghyz]